MTSEEKVQRENPTVVGAPKRDEAEKRASEQQEQAKGPDAVGHPLYNPTTPHGGPPDNLPVGQSAEQPDPREFGRVTEIADTVAKDGVVKQVGTSAVTEGDSSPGGAATSPGRNPTSEAATDSDDGEPRGQALDDALEAKGLSKAGTADEKRQRLAEAEKS